MGFQQIFASSVNSNHRAKILKPFQKGVKSWLINKTKLWRSGRRSGL
nr:MAG TPA: hypothetical protein [Bacteriophage sp.]